MTTLLLRFSAPMKAWGTRSRFRERDTGLEPSKSGVVGLLCAALGRGRDEPVDDLATLRLGVRVDREGILKTDYHTTGGHRDETAGYGVVLPDGKARTTVLSDRHYLADAEFLIGLEGEADALARLDQTLRRPRTQLFFGRKSFLPGAPVRLPDGQAPWGPGLRESELETELCSFPWLGDFPGQFDRRPRPTSLRLVLDAGDQPSYEIRQDVPVSFAQRRFGTRRVRTEQIPCPELNGGH